MRVQERAAPVYKAVSADRSGMVSQAFHRDFPDMNMMTQASMKGYNGTGVSLETGIGGGHGGRSVQSFSM